MVLKRTDSAKDHFGGEVDLFGQAGQIHPFVHGVHFFPGQAQPVQYADARLAGDSC